MMSIMKPRYLKVGMTTLLIMTLLMALTSCDLLDNKISDENSDIIDGAVVCVSAGDSYSMAIEADGSLWAWGSNGYGKLGNGGKVQVVEMGTTAGPPKSYVPVKIMENVEKVSAGLDHTLAVKTDGSLWAWGYNGHGVFGNGRCWSDSHFIDNLEGSAIPEKIMDNVAEISAGTVHSMAIKTDGSLWTWGNYGDGQLGNNMHNLGSNVFPTPVKIMDDVIAISAGTVHSMAIKTDGSLWTWGYNWYGLLGNGKTHIPEADGFVEGIDNDIPVKIMDNVMAISAGQWHSMAIKTDGSLWGWGLNCFGQLGDGTQEDSNIPIKIMDNVASVSVGQYSTLAIKTDGSLWIWGATTYHLHEQTSESVSFESNPVKIMDDVTAVSTTRNSNFDIVHTLVIKTDGSLWVWGDNGSGQLGNGTARACDTPIKITDI